VPIEIGRAVVPPDRPALAQAAFRLVDGAMSGGFRFRIAGGPCFLHRAAGIHEFLH
jgi:hypothetical protein